MPDISLIVVAIIGFLGQIMAVIGAAYLTQRAANKAQQAAVDAAKNLAKDQIATSLAARDAADAARRLVIEAKTTTDARLEELKKSADANMNVTNETHGIVNSQRDAMKAEIETMRGTIEAMQRKIDSMVNNA
jgi:polyhydroxyalkanoate synthesis regulator protein